MAGWRVAKSRSAWSAYCAAYSTEAPSNWSLEPRNPAIIACFARAKAAHVCACRCDTGRGRLCARRTGGGSRIRAQFRLAVQDRIHALVVHDDEDKISRRGTELDTNTSLIQRIHHRPAPLTTHLGTLVTSAPRP
jgi:hypothetical protein